MKHIKTFESFLNEGMDYKNEDDVIADAFTAFNSKFGTNLSIENFDLTDEYPTTKYFWSNHTFKKGFNLLKLKSTPEWGGSIGNYDSLEISVTNNYLWRGSKYNVVFAKAEKFADGKGTQALFSFPKEI